MVSKEEWLARMPLREHIMKAIKPLVKGFMGPFSVEEWTQALVMLAVAILIDFVGTCSYMVPGIGDLTDVVRFY